MHGGFQHQASQQDDSSRLNSVNVANLNALVSTNVAKRAKYEALKVFESTDVSRQSAVDCSQQVLNEKLLYDVNKKELFHSVGGADQQKALTDSHLLNISRRVPFVLMNSHAEKTNKAYSRIFGLWKKWCILHGIKIFLPADPYKVSLFMIELSSNAKSAATAKMVLPALTWAHRVAGLKSPLDLQYLRDISNGLQREFSKPRSPKLPLLASDLLKLIQNTNFESLSESRTMNMIILAYSAFLRFDELSKVKRSDLIFHDTHLELKVRSSKTDQFRQGDSVLLAKTGTLGCPVQNLQKYLTQVNIKESDDCFIFRNITNHNTLRPKNVPIKYTVLRELVLKKFESIGLDKSKFGIHSLRAGGATQVANSDIPDRLFMRHGRWASQKSKDSYVADDVKHRLLVSLNLGI